MKVGADDYVVGTAATAEDFDALPRIEITPSLAPSARHGFVGRVVDGFDPYSEADPAATRSHVELADAIEIPRRHDTRSDHAEKQRNYFGGHIEVKEPEWKC